MRNRSSTFDWSQAQSFLATAEMGSFTGAAELLGLSQPTVGRHVATLESDLGLLLFDRVGKSLAINDKGLALVAHAKAMKEAADLFSLSALGQDQRIAGPVSVTASDAFCAYLFPPIIERIRIAYPDVQLEIVSSNDVQDLGRREADIAIRNVQPKNPNLYAKRIRNTKAYLYGASSYLDIIGRPATLNDISERITFLGDSSGRVLEMLSAINSTISAEQFSIVANSGVAIWEAVKRGLGLAVMFEDLASITPGVEAVLQHEVSAEVPVWLVTHGELKTNARMRAIFDILSDELAARGSNG
ncbi:MAG: LysR family transcriptional regulator [Thalassospira sp.]|uniref:LysR family transcriptional regulator n=1 Tax=Thalassospira sp. GB04J01 TaxID=1485225 RepID=UPI000C0DD17B|nr:LysR family transcriptional regulator [Thalassospira sp. GB04J01]MBV17180.1 LysR family transcriptional regulator [Thalassospira sp.]|tara:strand:+ start:22588 stop:23490 length:903 start_codon:yes stop_codon:yes gene_type:complete